MSDAQHTPGPWFIFGNGHCVGGPASPDDSELSANPRAGVAMCHMSRRPPHENQANARLIAAAPDLLAACKPVDREGRHKAPGDIMDGTWNVDAHIELTLTVGELRAIRAAIAKAGGAA